MAFELAWCNWDNSVGVPFDMFSKYLEHTVRAIYVAHACANTEADACSHASSKSRTNNARTNASTNELIASSHRRVLVASMSQPKASVQKQQVPLVLLGVVAGVMDQNAIYMVQKCTITAVELLSGSVTCICQDWPS